MSAYTFNTIKDKLVGFELNYSYKLHYDYSYVPQLLDEKRYVIVDFDFANDKHFVEASNMINQGNGHWMMPDNLRKIMREPVFDPYLWFFVKEIADNRLIGIGISTYEYQLRETDIEWFYILPEYHRKGAGRILLNEIIHRSKNRSIDIRVGGTNEFYIKCGFIEKSCTVWAATNDYSFIAPCIQPNLLP